MEKVDTANEIVDYTDGQSHVALERRQFGGRYRVAALERGMDPIPRVAKFIFHAASDHPVVVHDTVEVGKRGVLAKMDERVVIEAVRIGPSAITQYDLLSRAPPNDRP
jgi:hypothetical protein